MKNARHNRISRLLPLVVLVGLASPAFPVSAGVNVWTTNGPEGRWIAALAIDPSAPTTLYAAAGWGGVVYKSVNAGGSWSFPLAIPNALSVPALAVDPSTPSHIYAAAEWYHGDDSTGAAFESVDGGANWTEKLTDVSVSALAMDPSAPRTLYAAGSGVFKSTDGGNSWSRSNPSVSGSAVYVRALAIDPSRPATLYAGGFSFYEPESGGVFRSTDAGASWTAVKVGLGSTDVRALAIDPANSATLYAGTDDGVFKSTNGGESWSAVNAGLTNPFVRALAIDPANSATLYAGTSGGGVFRSANGGASWMAMNAGLSNLTVDALAIDPETPSRIYAGTGGGVFEYLTTEPAVDRRILPVVGSTPGASGTFFRTSVQLNNPGSAPATGRIVFHPSGVGASDTDPALPYSLAPGETQSIPDLLPAMGRSGIGSADIEITSGAAPVATARVFNDAGASGTTGFTEVAMSAEEALQAGQTGVVLIPSDLAAARFNVGVRTLEEGASLTFMLRNAAGAVVGSTTRAFPANYHEQHDAARFLSVVELPPGGSISITVNSGAVIFYGAAVDSRTGDPSLQIASSTTPFPTATPTRTPTPLPTSPTPTRTPMAVTPTRTPIRRRPTATPTRPTTPAAPTATPTPTPGPWDY